MPISSFRSAEEGRSEVELSRPATERKKKVPIAFTLSEASPHFSTQNFDLNCFFLFFFFILFFHDVAKIKSGFTVDCFDVSQKTTHPRLGSERLSNLHSQLKDIQRCVVVLVEADG